LEHAVTGTLDKVELEWDRRTALGVVMAAHGYPEEPRKGDPSPASRPKPPIA
jgi:phosphoribosylamine--glycine ligase